MAFKTVIDCTNDVNIHHFLESDECANIRIQPLFVDDVNELDAYIVEYQPTAIILSTNVLSVTDMYNLIVGQVRTNKYILCVGPTRNRKDKKNLKVLQEEYNCSIIENVVTDLILMNHLIDCIIADGGVEFLGHSRLTQAADILAPEPEFHATNSDVKSADDTEIEDGGYSITEEDGDTIEHMESSDEDVDFGDNSQSSTKTHKDIPDDDDVVFD